MKQRTAKRRKNIISVFTLVAFFWTGFLSPIASAAATDQNTITISNAKELMELAENCSVDAWSKNKTVVLTKDISLNRFSYTPIPSFSGVFDGNGHTISGLILKGGEHPAGLFGIVQSDGEIRNLKVEGKVIPSGDADTVGGIAGINNGKIVACSFEGTIEGKNTVGGIVGINEHTGQIINCTFHGKVTGNHYVGGIVGENYGTMTQCVNNGQINTTVVEADGVNVMADNNAENSIRSTENLRVGTDIGGIVGFSAGIMQNCQNQGDVGYPHTNYNVGGIAGRQTGYMDGCVNTGKVLGRKDVGGIAGQMEPQVTLRYDEDILEQLDDELDVLKDIIDATSDDADTTADDVSNSITGLTNRVKNTKDSVSDLTDALTDWGNANIDQINDASARVSWVIGELEPVIDHITDALDYIEKATDNLGDAMDEIDASGDDVDKAFTDFRDGIDDMEAAVDQAKDAASRAKTALKRLKRGLGINDETTEALEDFLDALRDLATGYADLSSAADQVKDAMKKIDVKDLSVEINEEYWKEIQDGIEDAIDAWKFMSEASSDMVQIMPDLIPDFDVKKINQAKDKFDDAADDLDAASNSLRAGVDHMKNASSHLEDVKPYMERALDLLEEATDNFESSFDSLGNSSDGFSDIVEHLSEQPEIQFEKVGSEVTDKGDALDDSLDHLIDQVNVVKDTMEASADTLKDNMDAIDKQVEVIVELLRQNADEEESKEESDYYEDISEQKLLANEKAGRIANCRNSGEIEGDVNVAGIVGSMAIEYDFDPEDDITENGERSLDFQYQAAAVVTNSVHDGVVTAKKNYAGGIVGRMDLGIIYLGQDYGTVESTDGDYIGGIAGFSRSTLRNCFAKCTLSGNRYVGGILGDGDEDSITRDCYSIVSVEEYEQYAGAISGSEKGSFTSNYFVEAGDLAGLGRVSYVGKAEPISFDKVLAGAGVPERFKKFMLTFKNEDDIIKSIELDYGDSFDESVYPELPEKEDEYAVWSIESLDNLQFDTVVEVEYHPYITTLASLIERDNGRVVFYLEGNYKEGDKLESVPLSEENAEQAQIKAPVLPGHVLTELWTLSIPENGQDMHAIRFLPDDTEENYKIYYSTNGNKWKQVKTDNIGNYLTFEVPTGDVQLAICTTQASLLKRNIFIILVVAMAIFIGRMVWTKRKLRKQENSVEQ